MHFMYKISYPFLSVKYTMKSVPLRILYKFKIFNWPRCMTKLTVPEIIAADFENGQFWLDIKSQLVYFINSLAHYCENINNKC